MFFLTAQAGDQRHRPSVRAHYHRALSAGGNASISTAAHTPANSAVHASHASNLSRTDSSIGPLITLELLSTERLAVHLHLDRCCGESNILRTSPRCPARNHGPRILASLQSEDSRELSDRELKRGLRALDFDDAHISDFQSLRAVVLPRRFDEKTIDRIHTLGRAAESRCERFGNDTHFKLYLQAKRFCFDFDSDLVTELRGAQYRVG